MKIAKKVLAALMAATLLLGTVSCGNSSTSQSGDASGEQGGENVIKIGSIHPLTGSMAYEGQQMVYGQELVAEMINEAGGIKSMGGAKLEIVSGDSQGLADVASTEAERLIEDGCVALTGCYNSAASMTASQVAEMAQIPFLVTISSSMELMIRGFEWSFRMQPNTDVFCSNFVDYLEQIKTDDMKTIAIIYEDSITGYTTAQYAIDNIEKTGLELVGAIPYSPTTTSLSAEVTKLQELNPDVLLPVSYYQDGSMMFREFVERDMSFKLVIGIVNAAFYDARFIEEFGPLANGLVNVNYAFDLTQGAGKEIADKFKEKYGQDMQPSTLYSCYSIWVLAEALERPGTAEPEALRQAIRETNYTDDIMTFKSIQFGDDGENINAAGVLIQILDGESLIVYPEQYAQAELQLGSWPLT